MTNRVIDPDPGCVRIRAKEVRMRTLILVFVLVFGGFGAGPQGAATASEPDAKLQEIRLSISGMT